MTATNLIAVVYRQGWEHPHDEIKLIMEEQLSKLTSGFTLLKKKTIILNGLGFYEFVLMNSQVATIDTDSSLLKNDN